jgi:hypothetical protein
MALIPLKIPAGFYRTGTELDASGRWRDGSLVRWRDGSLRPIGGWRVNENIASITTNAPRSMHTWESNNGTRYVAAGSYNELFAVVSGGTAYDIAPTGLTAGSEDASVNIGYGYGFYGAGTYGTPRPDTGNLVAATTWSLDNWGERLVACSNADGKLYEWDLQTGATEQITDGDFSDAIFGSYNFVNWTNTNNAFIPNYGGFLSGGTPQNPSDDQIASVTGVVGSLSQTITTVAGAKYTIEFNQVSVTAPVDATLTVTGNATLLSETITDFDAGGLGTVVQYEFTADSSSAVVSFNATSTSSNFDISLVSVVQTSFPAQQISNAPIDNLGLIVTEERFLFALGAGGNPRKVQWSDREDNTTWTPASTNEAGDIELQTSGQIETAIRTRGQTLVITDVDAHTARYIGPPYVYGFERVGTSCGIISRQAAADVDMGVFWMGNGGFYRFDGNLVSEIPCDVHDYVFGDINTSQKSKTWAFTNGQFGEIWWFYASSNSTEIDRYVAFDYKENHWLIGNLSRTSGASRGVFEYPMLMDANGAMYDHEVGLSYAVSGTEQTVFAESGPISIGNGDNIMQVTDLIPDEKTQGDVDVTFKSRYYPNDTEYTHGPYTPSSPTAVRFSGRQIRMRVEGDTPYAAWRVGTMRVDAKAGGRR